MNCQKQNESCDYSIRLNWDGRGKNKAGSGDASDPINFSSVMITFGTNQLNRRSSPKAPSTPAVQLPMTSSSQPLVQMSEEHVQPASFNPIHPDPPLPEDQLEYTPSSQSLLDVDGLEQPLPGIKYSTFFLAASQDLPGFLGSTEGHDLSQETVYGSSLLESVSQYNHHPSDLLNIDPALTMSEFPSLAHAYEERYFLYGRPNPQYAQSYERYRSPRPSKRTRYQINQDGNTVFDPKMPPPDMAPLLSLEAQPSVSV